jgi:hypothetical protein
MKSALLLTEEAVGTIARALLNDRKALAESLAFWSDPSRARRYPNRHKAIVADLDENATALAELAEFFAPWLKQRNDWSTIVRTNSLKH